MPPATRPGKVDPLVGSVVAGRYRIEAAIASGGMGTVYRAEQLGLERKVALKLLNASALEGTEDSQTDDDFAVLEKRFSREAAILARLSHPNVVTIFDYGAVEEPSDARPRFYMAMELLGGETLHDRIAKRRKLPIDECVHLARQIARGLREAHAHGIVHRDLKPANIMIVRDRDGEEVVKLLDFGIGKVIEVDGNADVSTDPRAELTQEGRFVGSPMYMAPEQIAHGHVDLRADIYSFGTVLYRCIAGVHPFQKGNTALVMLAHLHEKPTPLKEKAPEAPSWLTELVDRCMAKAPGDRPATMEDVMRILHDQAPVSSGVRIATIEPLPQIEEPPTIAAGNESMLTPHTTSRPAMITGTQPSAVTPKKSRAPIVLAGLVVAFVVFSAVFFLAREKPKPVVATQPSSKAAEAASFKLVLESKPPGAEVREGDHVLGKTPFSLWMAPTTQKRTFTIALEGYQEATHEQGPSDENVHIVVPLQANPVAPPPTPSVTALPVKTTVVKTAAPKPSATPPPLDIIPKR
jgi:serine/threonine protein kinase